MNFREAMIEDVDKIVVILQQISRLHFESRPEIFKEKTIEDTKKIAIDIINDEERKIIVATDDTGEIYGLLIYKLKEIKDHINLKDCKILWIEELGVEEKFRKNGIGKILMREAEKIAKELECKRIELNCWNFNVNAINFYEAIGMSTQRKIMEKRIGE